tara:strand:- start:7544 stop:7756 length:213 start_codon:yes stop_codon:yes gene_type:complete
MDHEFYEWEDLNEGTEEPPQKELPTDKRCIDRAIKTNWLPGDFCIIKDNEDNTNDLDNFWNNSNNLKNNK